MSIYNPPCPRCNGNSIKNGVFSGKQRYSCYRCDGVFYEDGTINQPRTYQNKYLAPNAVAVEPVNSKGGNAIDRWLQRWGHCTISAILLAGNDEDEQNNSLRNSRGN
ncbi:MAG TPA: hypothetical protein V6C65_04185 [Allocoleopsis sp.]